MATYIHHNMDVEWSVCPHGGTNDLGLGLERFDDRRSPHGRADHHEVSTVENVGRPVQGRNGLAKAKPTWEEYDPDVEQRRQRSLQTQLERHAGRIACRLD